MARARCGLPSVDRIARRADLAGALEIYGHVALVEAIRHVVGEIRVRLRENAAQPSEDAIAASVTGRLLSAYADAKFGGLGEWRVNGIFEIG